MVTKTARARAEESAPVNGNGAAVNALKVDMIKGRRVVTMPKGDKLTLRTVNPLIVERLMNDQHGKPQVPEVEVKLAGGRRSVESNPNDPVYIEDLAAWNRERQMRMLTGLVTLGIEEVTPKAFADDILDLFPHFGEKDLKYLWIGEMLTDESQLGDLIEVIVGQTLATEGDIADSMDSFRSSN